MWKAEEREEKNTKANGFRSLGACLEEEMIKRELLN